MAHSVSARKRIRQNQRRRARNIWRLRRMRIAIKDFEKALAAGDLGSAQETYRSAAAIIDKTAAKGCIHRNQAARRKSRLNARLKAKASA